jgi:ribokinase
VRCAVVGHTEWVEFARVPAAPRTGTIVHAIETWQEPAGGGAVIARQLARLAGSCTFFTALGNDEIGRETVERLTKLGLSVEAQTFEQESRRAWTEIDGETGERTITLLSEKLLPRGPLPLEGFDVVYFVAGDVAALRSARNAPFLAATTREQSTLLEGGVELDLLVGSLNDPGEFYEGGLHARTVVLTDGVRGGLANGEPYDAVEAPGPVVDLYGAGDSFSAALCFGLARGETLDDALDLAAHAGAAVITGRGPYAAQLTLGGWRRASPGSP